MNLLTLTDPGTGEPLTADTPHSLAGGGDRWPVADGIPYLRVGRDGLRREALRAMDAGDVEGGLAELLTDQDPSAPLPPPSVAECLHTIADVRAGTCGLRRAMERLSFGPVADYFAVRPGAPTFLSGLGLLSQYGGDRPVVEVACGIGQLLREPARRGERVAGIDVVFSKLWLARRFVAPRAELVCGDVCGGAFAGPTTAVTVLCHDAFYFFPDKPAAARALARLAGTGGRVLVGHAHNVNGDHGGVAGNLLTPEGYAELFPGCETFDDAAFAAAHLTGVPAEPEHPAALESVEAVSLAWQQWGDMRPGPPDRYAESVDGTELTLNPLLEPVGGRLAPRWPSPRFAAEYRSADYLTGEPVPPADVLRCAADGNHEYLVDAGVHRHETSGEVRRLARRRILLPREDVV